MSGFDERWRTCAASARRATSVDGARELEPEAPVHRAAHWLSRMGLPDANETGVGLWRTYGLRGFATALLALVVCAGLWMRGGAETDTLRPRIENSMAQALSFP